VSAQARAGERSYSRCPHNKAADQDISAGKDAHPGGEIEELADRGREFRGVAVGVSGGGG